MQNNLSSCEAEGSVGSREQRGRRRVDYSTQHGDAECWRSITEPEVMLGGVVRNQGLGFHQAK